MNQSCPVSRSLESVSKSSNWDRAGAKIAATVWYISACAKFMPTHCREPSLKGMMYFCRRDFGFSSRSSQRCGMKVQGEGNIVGLSWIRIVFMLTGVYINGESKGKQVSSTGLVLGIVCYGEDVRMNIRRWGLAIPCIFTPLTTKRQSQFKNTI